jgi:hypothetical protein
MLLSILSLEQGAEFAISFLFQCCLDFAIFVSSGVYRKGSYSSMVGVGNKMAPNHEQRALMGAS